MSYASSKKSYLLYPYVLVILLSLEAFAALIPDHSVQKRQDPFEQAPLAIFQVAEPISTPTGSNDTSGCIWTETLMEYEFAESYYRPFVGQWPSASPLCSLLIVVLGEHKPPPCSFNRVTLNFTVTSKGRQFDRLAIMYLGDIEVFRTSTAEPNANGIVWTYIKEMDHYNALWKTNQKLIFDLPNVNDDTYTGKYNTILVATFFSVPDHPPTADTILPISAKKSGDGRESAFKLPSDNASVSHIFPQHVERAVISLSACGQIAEEFWYSNVLSSDVDTFPSTTGTLNGFGPFREVQLLIDRQLAGVSWPYPVIFTGGISPAFWQPVVGIDAYDLRQHEIDITPWLPLLCDGNSHSFEIRVVGLDDDGDGHATLSESVASFWVVTGTIFLFHGPDGTKTVGSTPHIDTKPPEILITSEITKDPLGENQDLAYTTSVKRSISISSVVYRKSGQVTYATWNQTLSFTGSGKLSNQGLLQYTEQNTIGSDESDSGYSNTYSYPITLNTTYSVNSTGDLDIHADLTRGLNYNVYGPSVFPSGIQTYNISKSALRPPPGLNSPTIVDLRPLPNQYGGALVSTTQKGTSDTYRGSSFSYSYGTMQQDFDFEGTSLFDPNRKTDLYHRRVRAENGYVIEDEESPAKTNSTTSTGRLLLGNNGPNVPMATLPKDITVRMLLGRGPGQPKPEPPPRR